MTYYVIVATQGTSYPETFECDEKVLSALVEWLTVRGWNVTRIITVTE